jgi:hypothetical protein
MDPLHQRTVGLVRSRGGRGDWNVQQRRQFRQSGGVGSQLGHTDIFHRLKQTRLVVEQQHDSIRGVEQGFALARWFEDRLLLIGYKNLLFVCSW